MSKLSIQVNKEKFLEYCQNPFAGEVRFELIDFIHPNLLDNTEKCNELISFYKKNLKNPELQSMHGAFFDIYIASYDEKISKLSQNRILESCEIAMQLRIKNIVFHTNIIPSIKLDSYIDNWVQRNSVFWNQVIEHYDLNIVIENAFDECTKPLLSLLRKLNTDKVKVCLDIGHCNISRIEVDKWIEIFKDYISYMHFNDNDGIVDKHLAVGNGTVDWHSVNNAIIEMDITPIVVLELYNLDDAEKSFNYLLQNECYPFNNY